MTLSDRNEEKVRSAIAVLVDATPIGAEFDDLTATQLAPPRGRRNGAFVFVIAFLVVGLAGGVMFWAAGDIGRTGPDIAASQDLTLGEWYEQTRAAAVRVHESPPILRGLPGPEPQFDVTGLGDEQSVEVLTPDTAIDWNVLESVTGQTPVISGFHPQSGYVGVAKFESGIPIPGSQEGPHVCTFALSEERLATGCSGVSTASDEIVDYGAVLASTDDPDGSPDTLTVRTPPGASVVAIDVAGNSYWQRPNGNLATFIGGFTNQQVDIVIYDSQGNVLHESSANL